MDHWRGHLYLSRDWSNIIKDLQSLCSLFICLISRASDSTRRVGDWFLAQVYGRFLMVQKFLLSSSSLQFKLFEQEYLQITILAILIFVLFSCTKPLSFQFSLWETGFFPCNKRVSEHHCLLFTSQWLSRNWFWPHSTSTKHLPFQFSLWETVFSKKSQNTSVFSSQVNDWVGTDFGLQKKSLAQLPQSTCHFSFLFGRQSSLRSLRTPLSSLHKSMTE